ncbi:MAG TPA: TraR/DksA C4-type zinc finger protein [Polyangia bacterium]|nr:TraR/DksA C4-type zinc finger protein [Polyangia bacterium]
MPAPAAVERHRKRLLDLKAEILAAGDVEIEPGRHDASAVGSDEDEQPLAEMSQAIASSRNRNRSGVLARVVAALARLEADPEAFGLCIECEEPISDKRLELMPYVELCVDCQQAQDGKRPTGSRKHLRDFR